MKARRPRRSWPVAALVMLGAAVMEPSNPNTAVRNAFLSDAVFTDLGRQCNHSRSVDTIGQRRQRHRAT